MSKVDQSVVLAGVRMKNPVVVASGTFGFGREYGRFYDLSELGGICCKGLTLCRREGNPPPRIAETPMGILNSVGLQNPGVDAFIAEELPELRKHDLAVIANISGNTPEEYGVMCEKLSAAGVDMIEVNISCPNVKAGGLAYGTKPELAAEVTAVAKAHAGRVPVMVKLSPNVTDVTEIARAVADAGADALSLINTLRGMRIDVNTRRPILKMNTGGLSGPAVLPVAVRMVWEVAQAVKLPILGMGGVAKGEDAAQLLLAGASAVAVGTACFDDPYAPIKVRDGLASLAERQGLNKVSDFTGAVVPWRCAPMERNTCYLNLSVAEAARTVSELVERAGLSSRMVDCHELRQGENLCGMVLLFEKYFLRMGSRLTLTAVLDNLEGRTRLYWTVTGGAGMLRQSGDSKTAAEEYSEALREKLFSYLDG